MSSAAGPGRGTDTGSLEATNARRRRRQQLQQQTLAARGRHASGRESQSPCCLPLTVRLPSPPLPLRAGPSTVYLGVV